MKTILLALCTAAQLHGTEIAKSAPVEKATPRFGRSVEIEAKFIEITDRPAALPEFLGEPGTSGKGAVRATLSPERTRSVIQTLNSVRGVDLLTVPRVTTRSGQKAVVEVVRKFRYPTAWKADPESGRWKPKTHVTKNVGVTLAVTPQVKPNRRINLHLVPEVTEFEGFIDLDAKTSKGAAKPGSSSIPEGHRQQPIFQTRKIDVRASVKPGDTVVLAGPEREDTQRVEDRTPLLGDLPFVGGLFTSTKVQRITRRLYVFVTARLVKAERHGQRR